MNRTPQSMPKLPEVVRQALSKAAPAYDDFGSLASAVEWYCGCGADPHAARQVGDGLACFIVSECADVSSDAPHGEELSDCIAALRTAHQELGRAIDALEAHGA